METATRTGVPSPWGHPTTLASFLLQAFACPAPWSPHYISPGVRSSFLAARLPYRQPPLGAPQGVPLDGTLGALKEVIGDCTLTATDQQYKSILTFGSYNKYDKPNLLELLACITLIAVCTPRTAYPHVHVHRKFSDIAILPPYCCYCSSRCYCCCCRCSIWYTISFLAGAASGFCTCIVLLACVQLGPLTSQHLQLFISGRLGANASTAGSHASFCMRVLCHIFLPLSLLYFVYLYIFVPYASLFLLVSAAIAIGAFLSLPSAAPEALSPLVGAFLLPCYAFVFPTCVSLVVGGQIVFCVLTCLL